MLTIIGWLGFHGIIQALMEMITLPVLCNFGGFIPLSTVDLPGRSACVLFLRGCPNQCHWCHNPNIQKGHDDVPLENIQEYIKTSTIAVSSLVVSGGEPTYQPTVLRKVIIYAKSLGLYTAIHTSGVFPEVLSGLISDGMVDHIALDLKTSWKQYPKLLGNGRVSGVRDSLEICRQAVAGGSLDSLITVHTLFPDTIPLLQEISMYAPEIPLIIQQGNDPKVQRPVLSQPYILQLAKFCGKFRGDIKIRTAELGEQQVIPARFS